MPKQKVMKANQIRGPNVLTAIVDGSWKAMLAIVKMKIETEYLLPTLSSKSLSIEVTEAEEMTPESKSQIDFQSQTVLPFFLESISFPCIRFDDCVVFIIPHFFRRYLTGN
ncbi:hypothetical protein SNOG_15218 [Parastagonospora nodorum SN15]|uniref:Uncharacterized protein n=1 Tax=Phaeosphaeria nodorum (strain SN15 / ATCC MYA-4574 / FGSC 10173) TaxID=321614 RepID=Q0TZ88_PHANO|nr:hypothetical protein SNOG_15218 [Parastagonospora nodorum SN15]EAT77443.1 hypothetical protein SNOG_15218 [Parastagonospora nodorum SN15]